MKSITLPSGSVRGGFPAALRFVHSLKIACHRRNQNFKPEIGFARRRSVPNLYANFDFRPKRH